MNLQFFCSGDNAHSEVTSFGTIEVGLRTARSASCFLARIMAEHGIQHSCNQKMQFTIDWLGPA